ncbi:MAG: type II toxin-antitoxin system PemK/MazF family toxin [Candidatus Woesearchaeota archaeon]
MQIQRGDKVLVSLDPVKGSEQGKTRPCIIVQNDIGNTFGSTTIIVPLTTNISKIYPTDVLIEGNSRADCGQIRTIDKIRIIKKIGKITAEELKNLDESLKISLSLN